MLLNLLLSTLVVASAAGMAARVALTRPALFTLLPPPALLTAKAAAGAALAATAVLLWSMARMLPPRAAGKLLPRTVRSVLAVSSARHLHTLAGAVLLLAVVAHIVAHVAGTLPALASASPAELKDVLGEDSAAVLLTAGGGRGARTPTAGVLLLHTVFGSTGLALCGLLFLLAVGSLPVVRRRCFETFYVTHHAAPVFALLLLVHGAGSVLQPPVAALWIAPPLAVVLVERLLRAVQFRRRCLATCLQRADHGTHTVILLELSGSGLARTIAGWRLGQHLLLKWHARSRLQQHPYMVLSHAGEHAAGCVRIAVVAAGSWSAALVAQALLGTPVDDLGDKTDCEQGRTAKVLPESTPPLLARATPALVLRVAGPLGYSTEALPEMYASLHLVVHRASPSAAFVPLVAQLATDAHSTWPLKRLYFYVLNRNTAGMAWVVAAVQMLCQEYGISCNSSQTEAVDGCEDRRSTSEVDVPALVTLQVLDAAGRVVSPGAPHLECHWDKNAPVHDGDTETLLAASPVSSHIDEIGWAAAVTRGLLGASASIVARATAETVHGEAAAVQHEDEERTAIVLCGAPASLQCRFKQQLSTYADVLQASV